MKLLKSFVSRANELVIRIFIYNVDSKMLQKSVITGALSLGIELKFERVFKSRACPYTRSYIRFMYTYMYIIYRYVDVDMLCVYIDVCIWYLLARLVFQTHHAQSFPNRVVSYEHVISHSSSLFSIICWR